MATPKNIADHRFLAYDDLSDCADNIQRYLDLRSNQAAANQSLLVDGAVTIDASVADVQTVTLVADASSADIVNPTVGQRLTLIFIQGAGGSHALVWPTALYAGGAAPTTSTTEGFADVVTYAYANGNWYEIARSVADQA